MQAESCKATMCIHSANQIFWAPRDDSEWIIVVNGNLLTMPKRCKALTDYESLDYIADLDAIEAHVCGNCIVMREHLLQCGVDFEDIDWERLTSDLIMNLTKFALYCNAHVSRSPQKIMATITEIGRDPQSFREKPEKYDPEAKTMLLGEAARLHYEQENLILQWEFGGGPLSDEIQIENAVPLALDILRAEAKDMVGGRPELAFQSELAWHLGTIFRNQGGKLRRDPKQLHKLPFRSFLELMIEVVQQFARKASFVLTATTMIEKAQEQLEPLR
jgi:hypothetical protein